MIISISAHHDLKKILIGIRSNSPFLKGARACSEYREGFIKSAINLTTCNETDTYTIKYDLSYSVGSWLELMVV